ncbi:MAG: hypothetical protein H5T72_08275 [Actinobacteria bacterium]|nr:hypothetical protein [Actinomycetota bacterium]
MNIIQYFNAIQPMTCARGSPPPALQDAASRTYRWSCWRVSVKSWKPALQDAPSRTYR